MKKIILFILLIYISMIYAITLEVALDGTKPYTSIQAAINSAQNGDSVLVYPGRYYENLDTAGKNIIIASLYARTGQAIYISNTIIDANYSGSCFKVVNGETVKIIGFILTRGTGTVIGNPEVPGGGGVCITQGSTVYLERCSIYNCNGTSGSAFMNNMSTLYLKGNSIRNNVSKFSGAGLTYRGNTYFNNTDLNSVYNNISAMGMDLSFYYCQTSNPVILDTLTVQHNSPDNYFVVNYLSEPFSLSSQHSYIQTVNHDLYVAPWGRDTNDGLSPETPLRNLIYASQIIASDSLNPKKIYVSDGIYKKTTNQKFLPIGLKSFVSLIGESRENTIIDLDGLDGGFLNITGTHNNSVANLTVKNQFTLNSTSVIIAQLTTNTSIKNILLKDNAGSSSLNIAAFDFDNITIEDIIMKNCHSENGVGTGITLTNRYEGLHSARINNVIFDSLSAIGSQAHTIGVFAQGIDLDLTNVIFSNSKSSSNGLLVYDNWQTTLPIGLRASNILGFNNITYDASYLGRLFAVYNLHPDYNLVTLSNITLANNNIADYAIYSWGLVKFRNLILYNPVASHELLTMWDSHFPDISSDLDIDYSLVRNGYNSIIQIMGSTVTWGLHNINTNPLFSGESGPVGIPNNQVDFYRLSENSPCIDSGTPDTLGLFVGNSDLSGNHRIYNGRIDMGAFEYGSYPLNQAEQPVVKDENRLYAYPNPVRISNGRASCMIEFILNKRIEKIAEIEIYNIKGQKIKTLESRDNIISLAEKAGLRSPLINEKYQANKYSVVWDLRNDNGKAVSSGIYLYRLKADGKPIKTSKITVLR